MARYKIKASKRRDTGKQAAKALKGKGGIPAVIYGKEINIPLIVPGGSFKTLKEMHFSESTVIDLTIEGEKAPASIPVLIKDIQFHPLTDKVIHLDLLKVSLKEKIKVHIPIVLKGEAKGKEEGAVLEQILREIEVEGLPLNIPENIPVDISGLEIGHSLHVKDLEVAGDIDFVTEPEETVATLLVKTEEEPEEEETEEAPEEPEVIKEKKEEGEEEKKPLEKEESKQEGKEEGKKE